jgi:hypothetical protein
VGANPRLDPVMNGADLQIDRFHRTKRPLDIPYTTPLIT